jgi:signal transduction histidine kinase
MSYGMILNLIALKIVSEPDFVKVGYSFKPHMSIVTVIIFILTNLLYFTVTKKREELFELQEKFASIGKQSSYIFHEIKKPINRLLSTDTMIANDIQQIKNILMNIDLLLKNPENFKQSFSEFNLKTIFENLKLEYLEYYSEYNIIYEYPELNFHVFANKELIQQVFKNLTINAIEAIIESNDTKEVERIIKISYDKMPDGKISISFKNTGSKITNEISDKIFSAFYTTKKSSTNNGLGLSFCKTIIEAHNGKIQFINHNSGPQFNITI